MQTTPDTTHNPEPEEQSIHLTEYVNLLLRHKVTILVSLAVCLILTLANNSQLVPIYQATATIIIDRESNQSPITGNRMDYETYMSESMTFNTHFELLRSRAVMEGVIRELGLDQPGKSWGQGESVEISMLKQVMVQINRFFKTLKSNLKLLLKPILGQQAQVGPPPDEITAMVESLQGMISIDPVEETRLVHINVLSPYPGMAQQVANATAKAYINFNVQNRMEASQGTLAWLTEQIYDMKKKLEDAEAEFLAFKQEAGLISMEASQDQMAKKINEFNDSYFQTRNSRLEVETRLKQLNQATAGGADVAHLRSLIGSSLIETLAGQLATAEVERARLSKIYKDKHPKVDQVNTQIANIRAKINQEVLKEIANLKVEREVLLAREKVLQQTVGDYETEAMDTNKKGLQNSILERNVEMNRNLYETLMSRMKETDITGNFDTSNIRITDEANFPQLPVGPNRQRNLLLGLIFGLMLGVGISFLWEYIDRSLRTEEDVVRCLDLPVLSLIPPAEEARDGSYGYGA